MHPLAVRNLYLEQQQVCPGFACATDATCKFQFMQHIILAAVHCHKCRYTFKRHIFLILRTRGNSQYKIQINMTNHDNTLAGEFSIVTDRVYTKNHRVLLHLFPSMPLCVNPFFLIYGKQPQDELGYKLKIYTL